MQCAPSAQDLDVTLSHTNSETYLKKMSSSLLQIWVDGNVYCTIILVKKEKRTKTVSRKRNQEEMDSHSQAVGGRCWILTRQGKAPLDGGGHFRL
jgi:hypothetical protein